MPGGIYAPEALVYRAIAGGNPDHLLLRLPLENGHPGIALLAFVGGLSAGTAMVIVVSVALSTMISNDLLMPVLMRVRRLRLQEHADLSAWVLGCRRFSIGLLAVLCWSCTVGLMRAVAEPLGAVGGALAAMASRKGN